MKIYEDLVYRGLIKDISSDDLKEKLNEGGLTFYIGTDPTGDSLHIGHFSSFLIAERLKRAGHHPIILIGGATGLIGDPKPNQERSMISKEKVLSNIKSLEEQINKLFGMPIVNNYDWCKDINMLDYLRDYGKYFNINYMLDKDIIKRRLDTGITYTEFSYMLIQALDFLHLYENNNCVMQVAGQDQWGNITSGIELIRKTLNKEAYAFTMPLITKKDGTKFGKTEGGAIWLDKEKTNPYEMYQFFINTEDDMVIDYLKKLTFLSKEEIEEIETKFKENKETRIAQKTLAKEVITFIHGKDEYENAVKISELLFTDKIGDLKYEDIVNSFKDVPNFEITDKMILIDLLIGEGIVASKREARELIKGNAISVNNVKITDEEFIINENIAIDKKLVIVKKGKKSYYLISIKNA